MLKYLKKGNLVEDLTLQGPSSINNSMNQCGGLVESKNQIKKLISESMNRFKKIH